MWYGNVKKDELAILFHDVWTQAKNLPEPEVIDSIIEELEDYCPAGFTPEDLAAFRALPNNFEVFRGIQGQKRPSRSWTLSREVAKFFTTYFFGAGYGSERPRVVSRIVTKGDVLFYTNAREEQEIVLVEAADEPSAYRANRGGHAPGHLRDALLTCLEQHECGETTERFDALADSETLSFFDQNLQRQWDTMSLGQRAKWLLGQLWNCTDQLSADWVEYLGLDGSRCTIAVAVRKLRDELDRYSPSDRFLLGEFPKIAPM
jgi:hypothetical protein